MNVAIAGALTVWVWANVALAPFQLLDGIITMLIAVMLWRYLKRRQPADPGPVSQLDPPPDGAKVS